MVTSTYLARRKSKLVPAEEIPIRYRNLTLSETHRVYQDTHSGTELSIRSRTLFISLLPCWLKQARRSTDLCTICEQGKRWYTAWEYVVPL